MWGMLEAICRKKMKCALIRGSKKFAKLSFCVRLDALRGTLKRFLRFPDRIKRANVSYVEVTGFTFFGSRIAESL